MNDTGDYVYEPLDGNKREIRLLEIQEVLHNSHDNSSIIRCRLHPAVFGDNPPTFSAISYTWGYSEETSLLEVDGKLLRIKRTAWDVLEALASRSELLWIDSVCIDQTNTDERNHQVSMMKDIYSSAEKVYAWLGRGTPESLTVMDGIKIGKLFNMRACNRAVRELSEMNASLPHENLLRQEITNSLEGIWRGLDHIERNAYWSRLWIVQEIVLAKSLYVVQGDRMVDWHHFRQLVLAETNTSGYLGQHQLAQRATQNLTWSDKDNFKYSVRISGMRSVFECRDRYHQAQGERKEKFNLTTLVDVFRNKECTDRRDQVYGLLALSEQAIPVDYRKSLIQVHFDVLHCCIASGLLPTVSSSFDFSCSLQDSLGIETTTNTFAQVKLLHQILSPPLGEIVCRRLVPLANTAKGRLEWLKHIVQTGQSVCGSMSLVRKYEYEFRSYTKYSNELVAFPEDLCYQQLSPIESGGVNDGQWGLDWTGSTPQALFWAPDCEGWVNLFVLHGAEYEAV
ncbi:heterokaryon incompatibility protein-domain-containing protein [Cladorrhinum sp. PSN259]|nr:heterokaryon incompatibility protein-domain-containing protein [Cladorrhinum sp. PSN259]